MLRVAKRFLTDKVAIVVVGDRASEEAALRKLAPLELRDLDGAPAGSATPNAHDVGPRASDARPATKPGMKSETKSESESKSKSGD